MKLVIYWKCPMCRADNSNCWDMEVGENIAEWVFANYCDACHEEQVCDATNSKIEVIK